MGSKNLIVKMILCTSLLVMIALINGVEMEGLLVVDSSGDGESVDLKDPVSLIDENGDIHTEFPASADPSTNVSVKSEVDLTEDSLPKASNGSTLTTVIVNITEVISESLSTATTAVPTEITVADTAESTQTNPPTTESTKLDTMTAISETTTVTTTTSTTDDEVISDAEMETSTLIVEATVQEKKDISESTLKRSTTESTVLTPGTERSVCTFKEEDFTCRDDLICYGEGEIDCTDYDDEDAVIEADVVKQVSTYTSKVNGIGKNGERPLADAATIIGNVKSAAKTEGYVEYDADASDIIETFPPDLVGVASHKRIPFILRPLTSTEVSPNVTQEIPITDENERVSTTITVQPDIKKLMDSTPTTLSFDTIKNTEGFKVSQGLGSQPTTAGESVSATPGLSESSGNLNSAETLINENFTPSNGNDTISNDDENVEITTVSDSKPISPTTLISERLTKQRRSTIKLSRRKRQDIFMESNSSSSLSQSFQVAALESTQRKLRVKLCRLSGDIVCSPTPTVTLCKGKSYCQAISSTADTTESATTRGVETWAIIVIVVCALSGFLTICLLIYLVVTSCKKLKVQPSIEVTTLNYINRGASTNEVA